MKSPPLGRRNCRTYLSFDRDDIMMPGKLHLYTTFIDLEGYLSYFRPFLISEYMATVWIEDGVKFSKSNMSSITKLFSDADDTWYTVVSRMVTFPHGCFPGKTIPRWSFSWMGRFAENCSWMVMFSCSWRCSLTEQPYYNVYCKRRKIDHTT